ncbi:MAG: hypothetical protein IT381_30500 [Deltaproteobacteria bacterium]|nr:hypothetical protein [Deltaproteobacteria bacterium]
MAALISPSVGEEKARALVAETAQALGMSGERLETEQCLQVLEVIAKQPGLVGISARFAKSRFHLLNE